MFQQLIESSSHRAEAKRKGSFLLGALGLYALLLAMAGVASVYAFDVSLERAAAEEMAILISPPPETPVQPRTTLPAATKRAGGANRQAQVAERPSAVAQIANSTQIPPPHISVNRNPVMEMPPGAVKITGHSIDFGGGLSVAPSGSHQGFVGDSGTQPLVVEEDGETSPPPPPPTPVQIKKPVPLSSRLIAAKTLRKPAPAYPPLGKAVGAQGPVTVEILIDEQGRVVSAHATGGHPLLRVAAEQAARQALFSPTLLNGQPVKVTGVITYHFLLK